MRAIVDSLILERAPWLGRADPATAAARRILHRVLHYERTIWIAEVLAPLPAHEIMRAMADTVALHTEVAGLENLPISGPALVVANHPTGIADGIVLHAALAPVRPDLFFFANRDALRVLPQLAGIVAPVEWRPEKRSHRENRATLAYAARAFGAGRLGVIFPSGRLAERRGLWLHERPWMASAAALARRFGLPVVPMHVRARNSALFYLFDRLHPTLRDITLFHEALNKARQPYRLSIGTPIDPAALPACAAAATETLRAATLALGGTGPQSVLTGLRWSPPRRLRPARLPV